MHVVYYVHARTHTHTHTLACVSITTWDPTLSWKMWSSAASSILLTQQSWSRV